MDRLEQFYKDTGMREAVKAFFIESLKEDAIDRVLTGEDTTGIHQAHGFIKAAFHKLDAQYQAKKEKNVNNPH